jgi:Ribbon-helix-helix protein, copG family
MRTARTTVLMTPDEKAALDKRAAKLGVSSGEYIRLAVDNYENISAEDEAHLAALVVEVNAAIPKMHASLDQSIKTLEELHGEMDSFLREKGIRK